MPRRRRIHLEISERIIVLRVFDILCVLGALYFAGTYLQMDYYQVSTELWVWSAVLVTYLVLFSSVFELYDLQKASKYDIVLKNVILTTSVTVLFFLLTPYLTPVLPRNRLQIVFFFLVIAMAMLFWRFLYITLVSTPRFNKRVLLIGDSFNAELISAQLRRADPFYNVIGYMDIGRAKTEDPGITIGENHYPSGEVREVIRKHHIDEILISDLELHSKRAHLRDDIFLLLKKGFPVRDYNLVYEEKTHRIPVQHIERNFYKFFRFSSSNDNRIYLVLHRIVDILISVLGILMGVFLVPFIFLGNLIGNRGSLFYKQERVGKNGEIFNIIKFRTMPYNAEAEGAQWTQRNDIRVSHFGKFLRRSRLDEFPQFYNILKGEMSLIGPRPERPVFVKELSESIPFYDTRHLINPGLTGWAQVMTDYADSHADSLEKLQYDLYYLKHRNVFMDLMILVKTLSTIIFFRGQ